MDKTEFLTIFGTFENLAVVKQTLPSIVEETKRNDARLIVHDSSVNGRQEKWDYLLELNRHQDFHLILSDNMSMAHARNMCLQLGQELFAPDYICMVEDDHGFKPGLIPAMIEAMKQYYGKPAPTGLRYGLFTGCGKHNVPERQFLSNGHAHPDANTSPGALGGTNSCFRCAPTQHWRNVLKGYDTDEYLISVYQTVNLNYRNYHKGFTTLIVQNGQLSFDVNAVGRGFTSDGDLRLWDSEYSVSDPRSRYRGKPSAIAAPPPAAPDLIEVSPAAGVNAPPGKLHSLLSGLARRLGRAPRVVELADTGSRSLATALADEIALEAVHPNSATRPDAVFLQAHPALGTLVSRLYSIRNALTSDTLLCGPLGDQATHWPGVQILLEQFIQDFRVEDGFWIAQPGGITHLKGLPPIEDIVQLVQQVDIDLRAAV